MTYPFARRNAFGIMRKNQFMSMMNQSMDLKVAYLRPRLRFCQLFGHSYLLRQQSDIWNGGLCLSRLRVFSQNLRG